MEMAMLAKRKIVIHGLIIIVIYYIITFSSVTRRGLLNVSTPCYSSEDVTTKPKKRLPTTVETTGNRTFQGVVVAWQCKGVQDALQLFWSLKTILFYRTTPIKAHVFADDNAKYTLSVMFSTWELPCFEVIFHNYTSSEDVSEVISRTVQNEKVLLIPVTMRFLEDVKYLYSSNKNESLKTLLVKENDFPQAWKIKPPLKNIANIAGSEQLKAFLSEPLENDYIPNHLVMGKVEELFDVLKLDGNRYKHSHITNCIHDNNNTGIHIPHSNISLVKDCSQYTEFGYSKKRTLLYAFGSEQAVTSSDIDVSIVTQLTVDRMHILEQFTTLWLGPMVVVLYITDKEAFQLNTMLKDSSVFKKRTNLNIHLVFNRKHLYPMNELRNTGIRHVKTEYCVYIDIDLLPNPTIYQDLKRHIKEYIHQQRHKALIIPAFEAFEHISPVPQNKTVLLQYITEKKADGFKMWRKWNLGHKPTDFPKWMKTNESYEVQWKDAFEPYVVLRTSEMPKYEPALLERMGDKIAYGLHLYAQGFDFRVLPDVFVIHMPHPTSQGSNLWKRDPHYFGCGAKLFKAFKNDIFKVYPSRKY